MAITKITTEVIEDGAITSAKLGSGSVSASSLTGITTDNVSEGSTNVYYTDTRARGSVSVTGGNLSYDSSTGVIQLTTDTIRGAISVTDAGGDGSLAYSAGVITYTGPSAAETRAHFSGSTGVSYNSSTGVFTTSAIPNASLTNSSIIINSNSVDLGSSVTLDTDDIGEGSTNLYYTDARVGTYISGNRSFGNITTTGYLRGPSSFTIDPATHGDDTGTVVIAGNLQVDGTTTTINSTTLSVSDKQVTLGYDATTDAANNNAGIVVYRPETSDAYILWSETDGRFNINRKLAISQALTVNASGVQDTALDIGAGTASNHYAYIDLIGDATYTDYGLRIIRNNSGANTSSYIYHRGTGSFNIETQEAASIRLRTAGTTALTLDSSQNAEFAGSISSGNITTENVHLERYQDGTVSSNVGRVQLIIDGKSGWDIGDELGSIDWYTMDGSGIGQRNVARIVGVNNQGNGSTTVAHEGELEFYTSAYNTAIGSTPVLRLDGSQNATFTGTISIGTDSGDPFNSNSVIRIQDGGNAYIQIKTSTTTSGGVLIGDTDDDYVGGFTYNNNTEILQLNSGNATMLSLYSGAGATINGLGRDWVYVGSGARGAGLKINDITGAGYAMTAGGYDLAFYKDISGTSWGQFLIFNAAGASNAVTNMEFGDGGGARQIRIKNPASGDVSSGYEIDWGGTLGTSLYSNPSDNATTLLSAGNLNLRVNNSVSGHNPIQIDTSGKIKIGDGNGGAYSGTPTTALNIAHDGHGIGIGYESTLPRQAGIYTSSTAHTQTAYGDLNIKSRTDYGNYYGIGFFTADSDNTPEKRFEIKANGDIIHHSDENGVDRVVEGFFSKSVGTGWTTVASVNVGTNHEAFYYEIITYAGDWSGHSAARVIHRGFLNGYSSGTYEANSVVENSGTYGTDDGAALNNDPISFTATWTGNNVSLQMKLATGQVTLRGYVRLIGRIPSYTIG